MTTGQFTCFLFKIIYTKSVSYTHLVSIEKTDDGYVIHTADDSFESPKCIVSVGRSGSKWMEKVCHEMDIPTKSNRVDIGVRVELPAVIFSHLTDELYESKIVYRTQQFEDNVRTSVSYTHLDVYKRQQGIHIGNHNK